MGWAPKNSSNGKTLNRVPAMAPLRTARRHRSGCAGCSVWMGRIGSTVCNASATRDSHASEDLVRLRV